MDLVGEIKASATGTPYFQRGITEYPMIGEPAMLMSDRELRLIYRSTGTKPSNIGALRQDPTIAAQVDIEPACCWARFAKGWPTPRLP